MTIPRRERSASLNLPHGAKCGGLLVTHRITAAIATRTEDNCHAAVLVINRLGQIAGNHCFIVGMGDHDQNIGLIAVIRKRRRRSLRQFSGRQSSAQTQNNRGEACIFHKRNLARVSKAEMESKLHLPHRTGGGRDLARAGDIHGRVRQAQVHVVQGVEVLPA